MDTTQNESSYGRFGVRAFAASSAFPIKGAIIIVRSKQTSPPSTVAVLETDESGKTPMITLEAPPKALSLSPNTNGTPYSLYDAEISRKGFYTTVTRNIQIYPDTTSVLPVNMIPLPDTSGTEKYIYGDVRLSGGETAQEL